MQSCGQKICLHSYNCIYYWVIRVHNRLPNALIATLVDRKWSNRWLRNRKYSTYSIILIECSVSCCQSKYSSNSDKHSIVIKKIEKIIITFYVFINLQFLINRFHRGGESAMTHRLISRQDISARQKTISNLIRSFGQDDWDCILPAE